MNAEYCLKNCHLADGIECCGRRVELPKPIPTDEECVGYEVEVDSDVGQMSPSHRSPRLREFNHD